MADIITPSGAVVDSKADQLWKACEKFIKDNTIICAEATAEPHLRECSGTGRSDLRHCRLPQAR